MRLSLVAVAIACSFSVPATVASAQQTPARDAAPKPAATNTIRGRVFAAENGRPLAKAQVRVSGQELKEGKTARTDAEGKYEFTDLPAGRFQVSASKAGYVQLQYGQLRAFESGKPLDLRGGQVAEKVDFLLPRGAVITGRVLDELGEPAVEISVNAMRYQYSNGRRRLMPSGKSAMTNDIGEFRIYGLLPGSYFVTAAGRTSIFDTIANGQMPTFNDPGNGYAPTYYPGTDRVSDAQRITVTAGQVVPEVQIPLLQTRMTKIAGVARDSNGKAITQGVVMAMLKDMPMSPSMAQLQSDGSFTFTGMTPGDYILLSMSGNPMAGGEIASANVIVAGDDIAGVQLTAAKQITVTGRVLPASTPQRPVPVAELRLNTTGMSPDMPFVGSPMPTKINDDQTFEMKAMPGHVLFRVSSAGPWEIQSVRLRGEDITDSGIEFLPEEDVSGIEIELTDRPSAMTGTVSDDQNTSARDYAVVAFAQDAKRWTPVSRSIRVGRPDQDGRFRVGVPAGEYYVVALDFLEPGEELDPDFLKRLSEIASRYTLGSGEVKTLELKTVRHP